MCASLTSDWKVNNAAWAGKTDRAGVKAQTNKLTKQMLLTPQGCLCSAMFLSIEIFYKKKGLCKNSLDEL